MWARILLIEDNPANLELMNYLLTAFGHTTVAAADGRRGLDAARRDRPDLIVCDVHLPELDGYEVARRLKSDPDLRTVPLVAVTALAMVGDRDRVLAAGFDHYITKPIDPETFLQQVEVFLPPGHHTTAPAAAAGPESGAAVAGGGRKQTILVVDNLPVNHYLARSILEPSGYRILTAEGMADGLALARREACDLILSDVCMAGGSGFDFIRAVWTDPQLRTIPFVFITSTLLDEKDRAEGLALGAAQFLRRPIEPEQLLTEIEACLRERRRGEPWQPS